MPSGMLPPQCSRPVNIQPGITAHGHRPEVLVFGLLDLVQTHPRVHRVELQVEGSRLGPFCSSPVKRARLSVKVSAMRKSIS